MKVHTALLVSAAAIIPVTAQAADIALPVKAKPVEYMRVCDAYGAGFWYVPGTQTCMKIGMYIRNQIEWQANGAQYYRNGANGRYTRVEGPGLTQRVRGWMSVDTRTKTDYGTLRGYVNFGAQQTSPSTPDEEVYMNRAFIQFGGLTVGRATSFYDHWSLSRYNYINNVTQPNMGASGQWVLGYTFRFGGGWSATIAIEDGGSNAAGANAMGTSRGKFTVDLSSGTPQTLGAQTLDNGAYAMPDIVGNVRWDQPWGSAQISGALHQNRGGYYAGGVGCPPGAVGNTDTCGYPSDEIGYAISAGLVFNDIFGMRGDSISLYASHGHGAAGYSTRATNAWRIWGSGRSIGVGWLTDSVFANGTGLELTNTYQFDGAYEHRWNREWRTSIYGGYVGVEHSGGAKALICSVPGAVPGTFNPLGTTLTNVTNCNPDFSWWNIGTRTQWNPHPYLGIGVDLNYMQVNTAYAGTATVPTDGARVGGPVTIEDQERWGAFFRIQYSMLP